MKYLIVGLGNIGEEYKNTRHNIGFMVIDTIAEKFHVNFTNKRLADITEFRFKGRQFILIKPTTFMNLSGKAVNYWMQKKEIPKENLLVVVDDIALPMGTLRLRPEGSDAGHNGLKNINEVLGHQQYARLRFGIGNNFPRGKQIDYVLGEWNEDEKKILSQRLLLASEIVISFGIAGIQATMNQYNNK